MKNIMIIAGEASGDLHGALLIYELKKIDAGLKIYGIGGDKMKSAGMVINYHINKMAFLGFAEVIRHIPFIKKAQRELINVIKEKKIKHIVLIDYPGFNLNFAKKIKKLTRSVRITYYISPQIWAWGAGRVKKIRKLIDKMIVVFPFEKQFYENTGVDVEFVGHPLVERINNYVFLTREELFNKLGLNNSKGILLILPGSRTHEVKKILPESLSAAKSLTKDFNLQIVVSASPNIDKEIYENLLNKDNFKIISGNTYDLMKYSKVGIIKSGTSTLEAALLELPMVIVYKTGILTYMIGKSLVKINNIGMANIILGERIVPELIQNEASKERIYNEIKKILSDKRLYSTIKEKLNQIKQKLGDEGASKKAAKLIYSELNEI